MPCANRSRAGAGAALGWCDAHERLTTQTCAVCWWQGPSSPGRVGGTLFCGFLRHTPHIGSKSKHCLRTRGLGGAALTAPAPNGLPASQRTLHSAMARARAALPTVKRLVCAGVAVWQGEGAVRGVWGTWVGVIVGGLLHSRVARCRGPETCRRGLHSSSCGTLQWGRQRPRHPQQRALTCTPSPNLPHAEGGGTAVHSHQLLLPLLADGSSGGLSQARSALRQWQQLAFGARPLSAAAAEQQGAQQGRPQQQQQQGKRAASAAEKEVRAMGTVAAAAGCCCCCWGVAAAY